MTLAFVALQQSCAQNVFVALGGKAWQFAPNDSLPAWLHRTTLLESKEWLRGELRRRRREQTAAELGTTMKAPDEQPALRALVPLVDEALLSLREKDRTALLLRFYESQSLREVGSALGVNEDAARKRVGSALEKLVLFFQRRGYRTATTAAIAAVLKHTAASTSATTVHAVVNAALQAAPPVLAGMSLLLARLTSLSKVQTAGFCVALAVAPVGWKWNEARAVQTETTVIQSKAAAARAQTEALAAEIARLRARAVRLDSALAAAAQARAERAESTRKVELFKERIRGLLTDPDYRWPEDLPFVRVPKSALGSMEVSLPVAPPGIVKPATCDMLGLTPEERQKIEGGLATYFVAIEERIQTTLYETNRPARGRIPDDALASQAFVVPALGERVTKAAERMIGELRSELGEDRWNLLKPAFETDGGTHSLRRVMNLDAADMLQEVSVWIKQQANEPAKVGYSWSGGSAYFSTGGVALSEFAPERIHDSTVHRLDFVEQSDTRDGWDECSQRRRADRCRLRRARDHTGRARAPQQCVGRVARRICGLGWSQSASGSNEWRHAGAVYDPGQRRAGRELVQQTGLSRDDNARPGARRSAPTVLARLVSNRSRRPREPGQYVDHLAPG
ncbi:MAG: sigma-70 family RNA polymerase sigma factor [Verrucomicrobia bacterium]|nr:sigma-70 family RNA polymerase sigma factor [Verrucomicrobiota bacterium]